MIFLLYKPLKWELDQLLDVNILLILFFLAKWNIRRLSSKLSGIKPQNFPFCESLNKYASSYHYRWHEWHVVSKLGFWILIRIDVPSKARYHTYRYISSICQSIPTMVYPETLKISSSTTLERTYWYTSVPPDGGQSAYQYLLEPIYSAHIGQYASKLRILA